MKSHRWFRNISSIFAVSCGAVLLSACVSLGTKAPISLLTLSSDAAVSPGASKNGMPKDALVILVPEVPRKLDTNRVPVQVDAGNIAYLKDSVWADKPAILFQQLMAETISANNGTLVLSEVETSGKAEQFLSGQLIEFGIDSTTMEAVVIFDAVSISKGKPIEKRRFQTREAVTQIEPGDAGAALNSSANKIAAEIASWLAAN